MGHDAWVNAVMGHGPQRGGFHINTDHNVFNTDHHLNCHFLLGMKSIPNHRQAFVF